MASQYNLEDLFWKALSASAHIFTLASVFLVLYLVCNEYLRYVGRIKNLPGPRGIPVVGNLLQQRREALGAAEVYRQWAQTYGPVFQIQLGNVTAVVVNSVEAARHLFVGQRTAVNSRPIFHVFHKQVSRAVTSIGTSPWDESCKQRRKVAATALNLVKIRGYAPIVNLESREFIREILDESRGGTVDVDFRLPVKRFSLNLVLTLNYGTRVSSQAKALSEDPLLAEIIHVESEISKLRDTANNYANYIPLLRYIGPLASLISRGSSPAYAADIGRRRLEYNSLLLNQLKERVARDEDQPCIQGAVLRDPESATLSREELISVSFSMMAGAESNQPTLAWAILLLAHRQDIQEKAYRAIQDADVAYLPSDQYASTHVPYVEALTKEVSRYYTVLKLALPKATYSEATWGNAVIPPNTPVFLNSWACNRDPITFSDPDSFKPERWLPGSPEEHAPQFAFGFGGRMCVAFLLAHNALYTAFLHMIARYHILPAEGQTAEAMDALEGLEPGVFVATPKHFHARFVPREGPEKLQAWLDHPDSKMD
ncbi:3-hydroxyphenylacetate 6-hydroxylase [Geosmithia morbida]|uniref:3-hydroxyphenylacetate 6-hydroxylase n=1 Tax=Geosmithia morbida TaxID=1094350 RepID=A0A9P4YPZ9_9HYPO|nr:3-hydroxyphenylacetate 6-hydroxylase [Geosmithia morbida]KAF4119664.1 3-hydroxyphenylacetate 6-hydroxylase [Geosmithia morbida]